MVKHRKILVELAIISFVLAALSAGAFRLISGNTKLFISALMMLSLVSLSAAFLFHIGEKPFAVEFGWLGGAGFIAATANGSSRAVVLLGGLLKALANGGSEFEDGVHQD